MALACQHRQPVALPSPRDRGHGVQPDGPADDAVGKAYDVDGRRLVIVGVPVPAAASEQALLDDEDLVTDPEVGSSLVRRGHGPAGQPEMIRRVCYRASGC